MIRRSLSACLGAAALVGALAVPSHVTAKPPDLPNKETITVTPEVTPENEGPAESLYEALPEAVPTPTLYQLHPTARRTLVGSMLLGINPVLGWLPIEKALDAPHDHPQKVAGDDVCGDMPTEVVQYPGYLGSTAVVEKIDCLKWFIVHSARRYALPTPEQNEGYVQVTDNVTCPYLRQQKTEHHACQFADPEISRDVLDNLERLKQADDLIETAQALAAEGCVGEAMECCLLAQELCPGSCSADRAAAVLFDVCFGSDKPAATEEAAEEQPSSREAEPGVAEQVRNLMKACRLLVNAGRHHQAAEIARQAYALDPERVMADPLVYKMHLLANSPQPHESSEECEPPSCPYCPRIGKPIRGIVPEKKQSQSGPATLLVPPMPPVDYEVVPALDRVLTESKKIEAAGAEEASEAEEQPSFQALVETMIDGIGVHADGGLRLSGDWSCLGNVYHLHYNRGCLAIWKTPDAAKMKP